MAIEHIFPDQRPAAIFFEYFGAFLSFISVITPSASKTVTRREIP